MSSVDRRRELNRLAAQKLRNRQKEKAVTVKQDYFAAQSRNTQLLYDVKQLRKQKSELNRQYEAHLPMCRHAQGDTAQSIDLSASQTALSGSLPQYAVYTSGEQQFISPLFLLSSVGNGTVPSTAVQFVTVAASDASYADGLDLNLTNGNVSLKQESENSASSTRLSNGDAVLDIDKKHDVLNGVCKPNIAVNMQAESSSTGNPLVIDTQADGSGVPVVDGDNAVSSVPASPLNKPMYNTRQRRGMSSVRRSSEPSLRAVKSSAVRHMSADQPPTKKAAMERGSLPLVLSSMTDDD